MKQIKSCFQFTGFRVVSEQKIKAAFSLINLSGGHLVERAKPLIFSWITVAYIGLHTLHVTKKEAFRFSSSVVVLIDLGVVANRTKLNIPI